MSTAADKARAKAARIAVPEPSKDDPAALRQAVIDSGRPYVPAPVGVKPIRISLDLAPALFDQLTEWRTRAARQLGRGRVTNADVLRALVRALMADEELTTRVITALRRESNS